MLQKIPEPTSPISPVRQISVRKLGINPNYWYVVARSSEVTSQPLGVTIWHQAIALYRDSTGKVHALEDRCPHRQVKLSHGQVIGDELECAYHGWRFHSSGECAAVPYLAANQKLPNCQIRRYPVKEQDGFIWLFPSDVEPSVEPMGLPEWEHLNYIATVSVINTQAHYSYLIENLMDMYHGHLHQDLQAWAEASLQNIDEDENSVNAHYTAQSYYKIDKIWSISQLFFPALRRLHSEPLDVSYVYPHWVSTLGKDFKIYCLLCPVHETQTKAYLIHFTSLNAFWRLHKLPIWFRRFIKDSLFGAAQKLLDGLVIQDVKMIEEEQQAYLQNPEIRNYELNRALVIVQKLMKNQVEKSGLLVSKAAEDV
ncbi:aromatic ring-hydroxylating dioxygenase subunit alpha [Trichormus variabilis]|uniref:3-chlorobenzoate-3,4-dioxygenase n=1 Tax=Trichormus variabilis SAG 1403-4b TaxID=447716 RepID=A0A433UWT4_ANAVA|nr:aromatic ring-hydroxylating dioxygenase subunit alpha [Trichormus variabilis]MBD2626082.1 aromatic ring-hydroxylating dioxygenase subunit alpha [Trichormus variabilis FACHB-164]RUS98302.1 3-chlorobenzoate-3,4-dioxygenase [Trichormus variabilis SAG 1403-4b]